MRTYSAIIALCLASLAFSAIEDSNNRLKKIIGKLAKESEKLMKKIISSEIEVSPSLNETIKTITSYHQTIDVSIYNSVDQSNVPDFIEFIQGSINLPKKYLEEFAKHFDFSKSLEPKKIYSFDLLFPTENGKSKFVSIFVEVNQEKTTNWLIGDVQRNIAYATKKMLLNSNSYDEETSNSLEEDLSQDQRDLFNVFKNICIERFAEVLSVSKEYDD